MNTVLLQTLKHRVGEIDESLAPLIDKAMEEYAKQKMVRMVENISHQPIQCYSEKVAGKEKQFFLGRKYVEDLIERIKKS